MTPLDLFKLASSALSERKLRTGLTVLMVIIGAALMTSLNGLSGGMNVFIADQLGSLGANLVIVSPSQPLGRFGGGQQESQKIIINDYTVRTIARMPGVEQAIPTIQSAATLRSGSKELTAQVIGMDQSKLRLVIPKISLASGSYVSTSDSSGMIVGMDVSLPPSETTLFAPQGKMLIMEIAQTENVGQTQKVTTKTKSFQIKGVISKLGTMAVDTNVYISLSAANTFFEKGSQYDGIYVITKDPALNDKVEQEIRTRFGKTIGIITPKAITETIQGVFSTFNAFISSIASVSMFVGAVGIITTLFTSVIERTKEIGLLKALGFNSLMVLLMFLTESIMIGILGGMLGVMIGIGGAYLMIRVLPFGVGSTGVKPLFVPIDLAYVALLSLVLSCVAGLYPAWRASRFSPLIALRKE